MVGLIQVAEFFESKINNLISNATIDPNVYNGLPKIRSAEINFMTSENVLKAMKEIKVKNSEGWDRIPQRILIDGMEMLVRPLTVLFNKIYRFKCLNNTIDYDWLNLSLDTFKVRCKLKLLNYKN